MQRAVTWNRRKLHRYVYGDREVRAVNKPEAARKLKVTKYRDIEKIKKVI